MDIVFSEKIGYLVIYLALFKQTSQHDHNLWLLVPNHLDEVRDG